MVCQDATCHSKYRNPLRETGGPKGGQPIMSTSYAEPPELSADLAKQFEKYRAPFKIKSPKAKAGESPRSFKQNQERMQHRNQVVTDPTLLSVLQIYQFYQNEMKSRMQEMNRLRQLVNNSLIAPVFDQYLHRLTTEVAPLALSSESQKQIVTIFNALLTENLPDINDMFREMIAAVGNRLQVSIENEHQYELAITRLLRHHPWFTDVILPAAHHKSVGPIIAAGLLNEIRSPSLFASFPQLKQYSGLAMDPIHHCATREAIKHNYPTGQYRRPLATVLYTWFTVVQRQKEGYWREFYDAKVAHVLSPEHRAAFLERHPEIQQVKDPKKDPEKILVARLKVKAQRITKSHFLEEVYSRWRDWERAQDDILLIP